MVDSATTDLKLNRKQLTEIFKNNPVAVRAFENLFNRSSGTIIVETDDTVQLIADNASQLANAASDIALALFTDALTSLPFNSDVAPFPDIYAPPGDPIPVVGATNTGLVTPAMYALWNAGGGGRPVLTGNRTYFVATTGSDSNDGLTAGTPFLTIQKAVDVSLSLDRSIYTITISIANGTYAGFSIAGAGVGSGGFQITGNTTTPASVVVSSTTSPAISAFGNARVSIAGLKLTTSGGGGMGLSVDGASSVTLNGLMEYGATVFDAFFSTGFSKIFIGANYTISGTQRYHWSVDGGQILVQGRTITLTGTPAFTAFAAANLPSSILCNANTFTGTATGPRYTATAGGIIQTFGSGASYLPGSTAGSVTAPGAYL